MTTSGKPAASGADDAPRFATAWMLLVYAVACLMLAYPALGGAFLINPRSDQYIGGYPVRQFAAEHLRHGLGFPQWNPFILGGLPYVAAMHGDIFYPTFLLRMILPTDAAMTWEFIIHLFLAGCFTYVFLRSWRLGFFPSLIGGLAYLLSGWIASYASPGHDGKLFVSTLFPLALWLLVRGIRDGRQWAWGALAVVIGLAVLSPHPQLLQYMLLGCGAFALYLAFSAGDARASLPRDVALRRLGLALAAVIVGALIGAVQFWPVKEYVPFSPRSGGTGYSFATSYSFPIEELFNTYLPQFTGILDRYWGRNGIHLHSEYVGAVVLMLAGAAFGRTTRRSFRWFWVGTFIVSLLWALGGGTPFYHIVYAIVPGSHYFRAPSTIFFITTFSVAVFAALGTERLLAGEVGVRYAAGWVIAGLVIALIATAGGLTNVAQVIAAGIGPGRDEIIQANNGAVVGGAWRSFLFVLVGGGVIFALARGRLTRRAAAWILVVAVAVDLWSIERLYWQFSSPAAVLYASDPIIDYLGRAEPGRVLTLGIDEFGGVAFHDPYYDGDAFMVHGVRTLLGYHGNELARFEHLLGKTSNQVGYEPAIFLSPPAWQHENVRYLYTNVGPDTAARLLEQFHAPPPTKLVGPVRNSAGSVAWLYRLPGDNPPAWLAPVMVKAPDDQAMATVLDPRFDPTRVAIVDTSATNVKTEQIRALPAALPTHVAATRPQAERISLTLAAPAPADAALVVSENYYPGWTAVVDGRPAPVTRADFNLIGVQLPAGASHVELTFRDPAYETGKVVTLVALLLAVAAFAAGLLLDRGRPPRAA